MSARNLDDDLDLVRDRMLPPTRHIRAVDDAMSEGGLDFDRACDDALDASLAERPLPAPPATEPDALASVRLPGSLWRRMRLLEVAGRAAMNTTAKGLDDVRSVTYGLLFHAEQLRAELEIHIARLDALRGND